MSGLWEGPLIGFQMYFQAESGGKAASPFLTRTCRPQDQIDNMGTMSLLNSNSPLFTKGIRPELILSLDTRVQYSLTV